MEWLIGESRALCQSSAATPNIITCYKMSRDYAYYIYKTSKSKKKKKKNLILNTY